ncbi:hypothetical protein D3C76_1080860 [compost metagenome]
MTDVGAATCAAGGDRGAFAQRDACAVLGQHAYRAFGQGADGATAEIDGTASAAGQQGDVVAASGATHADLAVGEADHTAILRADTGHVAGGEGHPQGGLWEHLDTYTAAADLAAVFSQQAFLAIGGSTGDGAVDDTALLEADLHASSGFHPDRVTGLQYDDGAVCGTAADADAIGHGDSDRCRYTEQAHQGDAADAQAGVGWLWFFAKFGRYHRVFCLRILDGQVAQTAEDQADGQGQTVVCQVVQRQCTFADVFHGNLQKCMEEVSA